ncbi:MAG: hypothetical protein ACRDYY_14955, partial [Acidimicrobiales bacterium]
ARRHPGRPASRRRPATRYRSCPATNRRNRRSGPPASRSSGPAPAALAASARHLGAGAGAVAGTTPRMVGRALAGRRAAPVATSPPGVGAGSTDVVGPVAAPAA